MFFRSLFERLAPRAGSRLRARANSRPGTCRLAVETLEDRLTPSASFYIDPITVVEGNTGTLNALIPVTLLGSHGNNVTVDYKTADGMAIAGSDYAAVSGTLSFNKNQGTRKIAVPIKGDRLVETSESFSIQLSNPRGATIAVGFGLVIISDDEPRVSIRDTSVQEGNTGTTTMTFGVTLEAAYDLPVTIDFATGGTATAGDDYIAASSSVTFQPGQTNQSISLAVKGDRVPETDETLVVNLTTQNSYVYFINNQATGTILDDEPHIGFSDGYSYTSSNVFFDVMLSAPCDEVVTVDFYTFNGSAIAGVDYVATAGTLTFNPGETYQTISVELINFDPGAYLYFYVQLDNPSSNAMLDNALAFGSGGPA
ncbi:MAG TPA: Calx-beta domain-containing protein [Gemmataceae bacterium]|nr:Calx-beta domain-containing protein [Gemmataceae bacterium]